MPKLDVGVGDDFPAKEVREDPQDETVVHHHHYYRRRFSRRSGRWLWFVLVWITVAFLFRLIDYVFAPPGADRNWGWGWGGWFRPYGGWHGLEGMLMVILLIAGLIWMNRWRRLEDERDAERRDGPGDGC
jgi:hypothetical protein